MNDHSKYHEPQVLYQKNTGYIVRCRACMLYQIAFGNFTMDVKHDDFILMADFIAGKLLKYEGVQDKRRRDIYINTPAEGIRLIFTVGELGRFNEMLQHTRLLVMADEFSN